MLRDPEPEVPFDAVLRLDGDHAIRGAGWKPIFPVGIRVGIVRTKNEGVNSRITLIKADDDPGVIPVFAGWHLFQSSICKYLDQAVQVGRAGDDIATAGANNIDLIVGANEALVAADEIDIGRANDAAQIADRLGNVLECFCRESWLSETCQC